MGLYRASSRSHGALGLCTCRYTRLLKAALKVRWQQLLVRFDGLHIIRRFTVQGVGSRV